MSVASSEVIGIIAGGFALFGHGFYIWAICKGTTKPHFITWSLSVMMAFITLVAYDGAGAKDTVWVPAVDLLAFVVIAILAWKYGKRSGFSKTDYICVGGVVVATGIYVVSHNPLYVLVATLVAEVLVLVPTVIKTKQRPRQEDFVAWTCTVLGNLFNFFAVEKGNSAEIIYCSVIFVADIAVWVLILHGYTRVFCLKKKRKCSQRAAT
jgi:hypothetical protein